MIGVVNIGGNGGGVSFDTIPRVRYYGLMPAQIGTKQPQQYVNAGANFDLLKGEILIISCTQMNRNTGKAYIQKFILKDTLPGNYGTGGTALADINFEGIFTTNTSALEDPNSQVIVIDDLGGLSLSDYVNVANPAYVIQASNVGLVFFTVGTDSFLFAGNGGTYGFDQLQTTDEDFKPFDDQVTISKTSELENDGDGIAPFISEISVQNGNGAEQFKSNQIKFKGVTFDNENRTVSPDPLVGGVIFVSSTGNDATAQLENRNKPFLTLNAALTAYWANPSIDYIEIISATAFTTSFILNDGTSRKFDLRSQKACIVTFTTINGYHPSPATQEARYDFPNGMLIFAPSMAGGGFGNALLTIIANVLQFNSTFQPSYGNSGLVNITANTINLNATVNGLFVGTGGPRTININAKTINFRGANTKIAKEFTVLNLNFDLITHDSTFLLNTTAYTSSNITHGSISSVAPYAGNAFSYMSGGGASVNFKTGATIKSNIGFSMNNVSGSLKISGDASYPNSDALVYSHNTTTNVVEVSNSVITCKTFTAGDMLSKFVISNSTIIVTADKFADSEQAGGGRTFPVDQFTFIGSNFIIGATDGFNLIRTDTFWVQTNKPSVNTTKGILYTNGKFNRSKIDIVEKPLNQYYDTTQRQLVIVNEKEEIINKVLDPTKTYIIDGIITLFAGEYVMTDGIATISGYGFDTSGLSKNVAGESIFKSTQGKNLVLKDISISPGLGSIFDIEDVDGAHAIEMNDVNFAGGASVGRIKGYRQITGQTIGMYSIKDGVTLSGTLQGLSITKLHVRDFGTAGVDSTIFKKDIDTQFTGRFILDCNVDFKNSGSISSFVPANFSRPKSFKIINSEISRNNIIDDTQNYTGGISAFDTISDWYKNNGLKNSTEYPYGINTDKLKICANDADASAQGVLIKETYIETATGYFKTRLI